MVCGSHSHMLLYFGHAAFFRRDTIKWKAVMAELLLFWNLNKNSFFASFHYSQTLLNFPCIFLKHILTEIRIIILLYFFIHSLSFFKTIVFKFILNKFTLSVLFRLNLSQGEIACLGKLRELDRQQHHICILREHVNKCYVHLHISGR